MDNQINERMYDNEIILYQPDSTICLDVRLEHETVWLSQGQMAELFDKNQSVIARHISNIFKEGELDKESNMQILHNTLSKYKPTQVYSLDVIISVGYRVKSNRGVQFRIWANKVLREYLLKGYSVNHRLLNLESRIDRKFSEYDIRFNEMSDKVDFFVKTSISPKEGVFYEGQISLQVHRSEEVKTKRPGVVATSGAFSPPRARRGDCDRNN